MKYLVILTTFLFLSTASYCATEHQQTQPELTFIKLWGFLKYYHPTVAKGKMDWDDQFTTRIKAIKSLKSAEELNNYYSKWIDELGKTAKCSNCSIQASGKANLDMGWLSDSTIFDKKLISKLIDIQKNRNQKSNHYIGQMAAGNADFTNEKKYKDSIFPSAELRLLTLARYWNIVNYFFPYRYQTDQNWNDVLSEMVPKFNGASDTTSYHLAILELTAKVNDSHAKFSTLQTVQHFGVKWVPFKFNIIDNKAVVTGFFNDSLSKANDIRIGDVFLKIGDETVEQLFNKNSKYIGASNESVKRRDMHNILFHGQTGSVETEFDRNGVIAKKTISRYNFSQLGYKWGQDSPTDTIKVLDGNIGYVNMGNLMTNQVPMLITKLSNTKAIIFDVRNYPKGTWSLLANFLNSKKAAFVKANTPDLKNPGTFTLSKDVFCGKDNPDHYKGKVILLCNENSQSHAEFTLMALQTATNVTTIGSQTSGADGNVSLITLPGDFKTYISGIGVYYPDGRQTQRVGIKLDVTVLPTIAGIRASRDEVLEKALETASHY